MAGVGQPPTTAAPPVNRLSANAMWSQPLLQSPGQLLPRARHPFRHLSLPLSPTANVVPTPTRPARAPNAALDLAHAAPQPPFVDLAVWLALANVEQARLADAVDPCSTMRNAAMDSAAAPLACAVTERTTALCLAVTPSMDNATIPTPRLARRRSTRPGQRSAVFHTVQRSTSAPPRAP